MKLTVESVQVMPESFVDTMACMYQNGGKFYFDRFDKWLDLMYIENVGGLRFTKIKMEKDNDLPINNV